MALIRCRPHLPARQRDPPRRPRACSRTRSTASSPRRTGTTASAASTLLAWRGRARRPRVRRPAPARHAGGRCGAGYVEGVGVRADQRRKGVASALMGDAEEIIRRAYDCGALGSSDDGLPFYTGRGWRAVARDAADPHAGRHRGHDRRGARLDPRVRRRAGPRRHAPVRRLPRRRRLVKAAYVVLSHQHPEQVLRLARTLRRGSPDCTIVLHHDDRRTRVDESGAARAERRTRALPSSPVSWGGPTQLDAFLRSLQSALRADFDWLTVLSGRTIRSVHWPRSSAAGARAGSTASSRACRSSRRRGHARAPTSSRAATSTATARSARRGARCVVRSPPRARCSRCARCRGARCSASAAAAPGVPVRRGGDWLTLSRRAVEVVTGGGARQPLPANGPADGVTPPHRVARRRAAS